MCMNFLRITVTFHDAVNIIYDVIITPNLCSYTAIVMFVGVTNNKSMA